MHMTLTMERNDDATLESAATTLRSLDGIRSVTVDEARSALVVDYDETSIDDEGEIVNRVAAEGIEGVRILTAEES